MKDRNSSQFGSSNHHLALDVGSNIMSQHSFNKIGIDIMGSGIRTGNIHSETGISGSGMSSKDNGHGSGADYKKKFVNERQATYEKISYKQNLSHPNTATSTILNNNNNEKEQIQMIIGKPALPQQISPATSNQALEQYYSNAKSNQQNQVNNNQSDQLQQLPNQQLSSTSQQYQSNRSVAAKAGQMHIFNSQQISLTNKAKKFVSPPMSYYGKFQNNQQQESVEFQPMKMKGGSNIQSGQIQNPKYVDYINRIQQQEFSTKPPLASNYKSKEEHFMQSEEQDMLQSDSIQSYLSPNQQQESNGISIFRQNQTLNNSQNKNAQQNKQMPNLNISGEQMHIEEKSLTRKAMIAGGGFDNGSQKGTNVGPTNSLSIKRIDLQVNAVGIVKQQKINDEMKGQLISNGSNIGHRIYDYVFVQMSQDKFDKEFSTKIQLSKDQSNTAKVFTDKRHSNNSTIIKKPTQISVQHQGQLAVRYKGIRTSSDQVQAIRNTNDTFFSPQNQTTGGLLMDDIVGQQETQLLQGDKQIMRYSLMATQIDHIKIIGSNRFPEIINNLTEDEQNKFAEYMKDIITKISEKGRKFKITVKRKYIQDGLTTSPQQRISSVYVIVITSSPSLNFANTSSYEQTKNQLQLSQTIKAYSSSGSSSSLSDYIKNYNYKENMGSINNKNIKGLTQFQGGKEGSQSRQGTKQMQITKVRNNSTIQASNKAGYESENETTKSMNSTTTSSTVPFFPTRNFDNNNNGTKMGTNTKNSARSLSQKGGSHPSIIANNSRKGQQKIDESQFSSTQLITNKGEGGTIQGGKYPPTKIKIVQQNDYAHLENHRINKALVMYNQFIQLAFRTKGKLNVNALNNLAKQMNIKIASSAISENGIKSREQGNLIKEKLIFYISKIINEENQPEGFINQDKNYFDDQFQGISHPQQLYKCFVGKGNNSILIRTLFKTRFWWLLHDKEEIEKVNFMWTQLRKNAIMDTFSCKFQDKKSNIRITSTANNEINTPTMSTGKNMKKKKAQLLQSSTQSLENSSEKKDQQQFSKAVQQQIDQQQQQQQQQQLVAAQLNVKLYNKLEDNFHLSNKKALFINMRNYYEAMNKDVFSAVPVTFHVKEGLEDPEFIKFKAYYNKEEEEIKKQKNIKQSQSASENEIDKAIVIGQPKKNIWILKPGENTNRGNGIMVAKDFDEIKRIIEESTASRKRTCIIQKYIHNPLLINKRKFDIRAYGFFTSVNGNLKGYFYSEGYLRTSSKEFTLNNLGNRMIHLTNDAVQKKSDDYGKFEAGNKLSYIDFQNFFDKIHPDLNICFERDLLPQMKKLATDTFRAVYNKIDPKRRINTFEIYGYDFMFDDEFKVYLIEVNTNPCLELGCPLLARLIPNMVENALRLTVDPLFPPPENFSQKKCIVNDICPENKYELVFDERVDGPFLTELMKEKNNIIIEIDEEELSDCDEREDGDN